MISNLNKFRLEYVDFDYSILLGWCLLELKLYGVEYRKHVVMGCDRCKKFARGVQSVSCWLIGMKLS